MANKTPLALWLYSKRKELNPQFNEFDWTQRILPSLFDFSTTIAWDGLTAEGRGVDSQREIALEKSVSEAIERLICYKLNFHSVGLALAGNFDPSTHAKHETLERYFLDQHLQRNIPFQKTLIESPLVQEFSKHNSKTDVAFYRMHTSPQLYGIICSLTPINEKRRAIGFALSDSMEESVRRSMLEALPNYAWLLEGQNNFLPKETLPWHIDEKFLTQIEPLLTEVELNFKNQNITSPKLKRVNVSLDEIDILKNAPIQVARYVLDDSDGYL